MGRTRVRIIERAGLVLGVELPSSLARPGQHATGCGEPDIWIGTRVGRPEPAGAELYHYRQGDHHFGIGREPGGWVLVLDGGRRIARFDPGFALGEVVLEAELAQQLSEDGGSPVAPPLDELVVLHRLCRDGAFVVRGALALSSGRAIALVGAVATGAQSGEPLALRISERGVRAVPWRSGGRSLEIESIELVERDSVEAGEELLPEDEASAGLLRHGFAPVHDRVAAERAGRLAQELATRVRVRRLSLLRERRVVPFAWGGREASLAFAAPSS